MKKKHIRFKKSFWILLFVIFASIIGIIAYNKHQKYINSPEYLLAEKGYTEAQINNVISNNKIVKILLEKEYNPYILDIMNSKYYIEKNLEKYLTYKEKYPNTSYDDVIAIINVKANTDWYSTISDSDLTKENLILVNKFHSLSSEYEIEDLTEMNVAYAYSGKSIKSEVYSAFKSLSNAAKKQGLTIIATNTYRSYSAQEKTYNTIKSSNGREYADNYAARPGHSEHQTGLAIDVNTISDSFAYTNEYKWLKENAYKYGYILRYPKEYTNLTGYKFEPWHYRYVGVDIASYIHNHNITYDEYYEYFIKGL